MRKHLDAHPRTIIAGLGSCLVLAACGSRFSGSLTPLLVAWLTATVYAAGLALILVAFGYCYRPLAWLRTLAQCAVVAAVALGLGFAAVAWHQQRAASHPLPAAAIAGSDKR
jgi:CBS domain containing-hemolysin-like protein